MHRLTDVVVASEREGQVADTARHMRSWQVLANPFGGTDEVQSVVVVLLHTCGNSQHVGVEDDVQRIEAHLIHQQTVGTFTDFYLAFKRGGLSLLVKCHHDGCSTQAFDFTGFLEELLFALLQRDAVDNALALHTFQTCCDNLPIAGINHHWHLRDIRIAHQEIQEGHHLMLGVQESIIHIDVEHQSPILHLLSSDGKGLFIILFVDETQEFPRTCHITAFTHIHKATFRCEFQQFQTAQPHVLGLFNRYVWFLPLYKGRIQFDEFLSRSTATTQDVDQSLVHILLHLFRHHVGRLVVESQGIGQSCIRVC